MTVDQAGRRTRLPRLDDRLMLGGSGLEVSPFCLGMVRARETVPAAFDAGINFFFVTADMHWPHYEELRLGLADVLARGGGVRDQIVVAVVTYLSRSEQLYAPFLEVIEAIPKLERIDVMVAGWAVVEDDPGRGETLKRHKAEGFAGCRALGASFHDRSLVAGACNAEEVDIAYVRYNARHNGASTEVFPHRNRTKSLLYGFKSTSGYRPDAMLDQIPSLPEGLWRPAIPDHYRFALTPPAMDGLLCSPATPEHVRALAAAIELGPLTEDEELHLTDLAFLADGDAEIVEDATGTVR